MIGTGTPLRRWGARRWFTKTATHEDFGHLEELMGVTLACPHWTTTGATYFIPPKCRHIASQGWQNFPPSIASFRTCPHTNTSALCTLTDELVASTTIASLKAKGQLLLKLLQSNIAKILNPPPLMATPRTEQRVGNNQQRVREEQQRVIDESPTLTIP